MEKQIKDLEEVDELKEHIRWRTIIVVVTNRKTKLKVEWCNNTRAMRSTSTAGIEAMLGLKPLKNNSDGECKSSKHKNKKL